MAPSSTTRRWRQCSRKMPCFSRRIIVAFGISYPEDFDEEKRVKMREVANVHKRSSARTVKAGVRITLA